MLDLLFLHITNSDFSSSFYFKQNQKEINSNSIKLKLIIVSFKITLKYGPSIKDNSIIHACLNTLTI